jgi:hypothetical protein
MANLNMLVQITTIARLMAGDFVQRKLPAYLFILFILALATALLLTAFLIGSFVTLFMVLTDNGLGRSAAAGISLIGIAFTTAICALVTRHILQDIRRTPSLNPLFGFQHVIDAFLKGLSGRHKK